MVKEKINKKKKLIDKINKNRVNLNIRHLFNDFCSPRAGSTLKKNKISFSTNLNKGRKEIRVGDAARHRRCPSLLFITSTWSGNCHYPVLNELCAHLCCGKTNMSAPFICSAKQICLLSLQLGGLEFCHTCKSASFNAYFLILKIYK